MFDVTLPVSCERRNQGQPSLELGEQWDLTVVLLWLNVLTSPTLYLRPSRTWIVRSDAPPAAAAAPPLLAVEPLLVICSHAGSVRLMCSYMQSIARC